MKYTLIDSDGYYGGKCKHGVLYEFYCAKCEAEYEAQREKKVAR